MLGADASVAAGMVARQVGGSTDLKLGAQILSYSRSKWLFAGLELKGLVIKLDKDDMRDVYCEGVTAKEVLKENKVTAPAAARAFPNTLGLKLFRFYVCRGLAQTTSYLNCQRAKPVLSMISLDQILRYLLIRAELKM